MFLTTASIGPTRINKIRSATGFLNRELPFEYFGCPIYNGRKRSEYFEKMLSKVIRRLNGWQSNMLSYWGKMILIKSVLQSLPMYTLTSLTPRKGIIKLIEKHFARFFWGSTTNKDKYHWSSWRNICYPKEEGGLGVRSMKSICETLDIKKWWRFRTHDSLWAKYTKAKYCVTAHPVTKVWVSRNSGIEKL